MRDAATTAGEVLGLGVVAVGFGLMWAPLGVVAAGVALVSVCVLAGRR